MNEIKVRLRNCFGIQSLVHEFKFDPATQMGRAYAIYAPNGLMKTSFAKTFELLSKGESPREERFNRPSTFDIKVDGGQISEDAIYVLKSEIDIRSESTSATNILVDARNKARYDELLVTLDKLKAKAILSLQKASKVPKTQIENQILSDWDETDFLTCLSKIKKSSVTDDLSAYTYATIFDPKAIDVLNSPEFISKANEFNQRYQELFQQAGTIYQKGVFNPAKAETSFKALDNHGFFAGGHRVHFRGESASVDKDELNEKLRAIHAKIDGDETLKKLRVNLAANAKVQALIALIESLSATDVEYLLEKLKPNNLAEFRKELWAYYVQNNPDIDAYIEAFEDSKNELQAIEAAAAIAAPKWTEAVDRFNDRFVDMPFTLAVGNQQQAALGKAPAQLKYIFTDGSDVVEQTTDEVKMTLSLGEKRALYLLYFIFDVEARKLDNQKTLFIIDDAADSFDYKNKHAIVQYLDDLSDVSYFRQIVLTHNFDFFRTLAVNGFVHRDRCLMTTVNNGEITLVKAEGVQNIFTKKWKKELNKTPQDECVLCATVPFTRNLIEYTKGTSDPDYLILTSLLHWKSDSDQITVGDYLNIYNSLFNKTYPVNDSRSMKGLLLSTANDVCSKTLHDGLNLEDKVVLSMAIRMQAEIFLINELRRIKSDPTYWCQESNQFAKLITEFRQAVPNAPELKTLEKVKITVSSNIHLNSFMYEPILDLTIDHLINIFTEVSNLNTTIPGA